VQKPTGKLTGRVQAVGPEHFGILSIDCAKARSKLLLCDFYGTVLLPPAAFAHTRGDLLAAVARLLQAAQQRGADTFPPLGRADRDGVHPAPVAVVAAHDRPDHRAVTNGDIQQVPLDGQLLAQRGGGLVVRRAVGQDLAP
jgi:hypothetical protein